MSIIEYFAVARGIAKDKAKLNHFDSTNFDGVPPGSSVKAGFPSASYSQPWGLNPSASRQERLYCRDDDGQFKGASHWQRQAWPQQPGVEPEPFTPHIDLSGTVATQPLLPVTVASFRFLKKEHYVKTMRTSHTALPPVWVAGEGRPAAEGTTAIICQTKAKVAGALYVKHAMVIVVDWFRQEHASVAAKLDVLLAKVRSVKAGRYLPIDVSTAKRDGLFRPTVGNAEKHRSPRDWKIYMATMQSADDALSAAAREDPFAGGAGGLAFALGLRSLKLAERTSTCSSSDLAERPRRREATTESILFGLQIDWTV